MFFARKRSGSGRCFLRESEAAAADVFCAKAKRQRQMFFVRKRSANVASATRCWSFSHCHRTWRS
ncbi:hypothetical protein ACQKNB_20310 [Lysinibacillus xylanilyticus]|uniref:hypothetical protein n=1 Tax=Lysinibacillus xylanilyticus TaxID=582475 RepID=UPI003D047168